MMSMTRKIDARVPALPSLFERWTWDFECQTIYITTHCLICSHDHENLFERWKLLDTSLRYIKTMKHRSPIEINPMMNQETDWGLKPYSLHTERQRSRMTHSYRYSKQLAGKSIRRKSNQPREKGRFCLVWREKKPSLWINRQPIPPLFLKTGYRQTDESFLYRLTDAMLSIWRITALQSLLVIVNLNLNLFDKRSIAQKERVETGRLICILHE